MKLPPNPSSQLKLFSSHHTKTPMEIISQLERIHYRYKRYSELSALQIAEILETFKKVQAVDQNKFHHNLNALKSFNKVKETKWGIAEYLYISLKRSTGKKNISLVRPDSFPKIQNNIDLLQNLGFSPEELNYYLFKSMQLVKDAYLGYSPSRNKNHIDWLKNDLALSNEQTRIFIHQIPDFFYCPLEKYQEKISCLQKLGCGKEDIIKIISSFPYCLRYSESKLTKTFQKLSEVILTNSKKVLLDYPHLFYFNTNSEFFQRLVVGLSKGNKRYQAIIERIAGGFSYRGIGKNHSPTALSIDTYLQGLHTEEYKRYFSFNPEESKKAFTKYKEYVFAECLKYLSLGEQQSIMKIHTKTQKEVKLSKQESLAFEYIKSKIEKKNQQCYNDLLKLFNYKENIKKIENEDLSPDMENSDDISF
ncbi:MAG: hypothetical protein NTY80_01670 [candidate division SR1 bacterium]|nr:hypothetical protein [candidate division SR1 bacterium]